MENSQYLRRKVLAAEIQVEIQGANMTEFFFVRHKKETNK
jgi:hypothetical protein